VPVWKQLLVLLVLAGIAFGGYEGYRTYLAPPEAVESDDGPSVVSVETAVAERRSLARAVEAVGTTRARRSVEIVPLEPGRVAAVNFRTGERVDMGDVLVELDDDIERADLAEAEAMLAERRQAVERTRQLQQSNAVSLAQLELVLAQNAAAEAQLDRARRRLADRDIRAPFAGVVGLTDVDPGARVEEGEAIARIDDLSEVEIEFSLPETLFAEIRPGQPVTAGSAAFPGRVFTGEVGAIDTRIDEIGRSFKVRAVLPNPEGALPAGMFMFLTLVLEENEAVTVPEEAVIAQAAETYVYVVEGGAARRRPVATGQRQDGRIAILDGLAEGEVVVTRGIARLRDGAAVRVLNEPATAAAPARGDGT
jgi:membrane fusion protein (multidrug efflux system)